MTDDLKTAWVAALRSGRYKQGRGSLRSSGRHCAFGVLLDLYDPHGWSCHGGLWAHWASATLGKGAIGVGAVISDNDHYTKRLSFAQIADKVEAGAYDL